MAAEQVRQAEEEEKRRAAAVSVEFERQAEEQDIARAAAAELAREDEEEHQFQPNGYPDNNIENKKEQPTGIESSHPLAQQSQIRRNVHDEATWEELHSTIVQSAANRAEVAKQDDFEKVVKAAAWAEMQQAVAQKASQARQSAASVLIQKLARGALTRSCHISFGERGIVWRRYLTAGTRFVVVEGDGAEVDFAASLFDIGAHTSRIPAGQVTYLTLRGSDEVYDRCTTISWCGSSSKFDEVRAAFESAENFEQCEKKLLKRQSAPISPLCEPIGSPIAEEEKAAKAKRAPFRPRNEKSKEDGNLKKESSSSSLIHFSYSHHSDLTVPAAEWSSHPLTKIIEASVRAADQLTSKEVY